MSGQVASAIARVSTLKRVVFLLLSWMIDWKYTDEIIAALAYCPLMMLLMIFRVEHLSSLLPTQMEVIVGLLLNDDKIAVLKNRIYISRKIHLAKPNRCIVERSCSRGCSTDTRLLRQ